MYNNSVGLKRIRYSEYILLFLILLVSPETVMFGTNSNTLFVNIKYVLIFSIVLFYGGRAMRSIYKKNTASTMLLIMCALIVFTGIMCMELRGGYFLRIVLILAAYCYTVKVSKYDFARMFYEAIYIIAIFSIVSYVLYLLFPSGLSFLPKISNSNGMNFYTLILCNIPIGSTDRLWGPYSEPGTFQIVLNVALIFYVALNKQVDYKRIAVFIGAIVLTKSTSGYITLAFVLLYVINQSANKAKSYRFVLIFLLILSLGALASYTDLLSADGEVFDKFQDTQRSSTVSRYASVVCNLQMFMKSPLWGVGLTGAQDMFPLLSYQNFHVFSESNTNQLLYQFASLGFFFGIIWTLGGALFFQSFGRSVYSKCLLIVAFILLCVGENLTYSILFYLFIFYGFQESNKKLEQRYLA